MDRLTIEKRDREVMEKFRTVVDVNERRKKIARWRFAGVVLVLAVTGGFFSYKYMSSPVILPVRYASNPVAVTRIPSQEATSSSGTVARDQKNLNQPRPADFTATKSSDPNSSYDVTLVSEKIAQTPTVLLPDPDLKSFEKIAVADPDRVLEPRAHLAKKPSSPAVGKSLSALPHLHIAEIVTCRGVDDRQPVSRQKVFSMGKGETPHVWMDVRSTETPQTLRHIYYHNGRRYCTVRLDVNYPRMRTWSNVSLKHPHETGQWRVDVVTAKGKVLSQAEFTVVY